MELINETPMPAAFVIGQARQPAPSESETAHVPLTLVVKGTFELMPGQAARFAEEMLLPTGDEPYEDDPDALGGPRYASDFVPIKPRADLLLVGHCHSPGGAARSTCSVSFEVGNARSVLDVHGDREWQNVLLGRAASASAPRPFVQMPLRYERAYGGPGWKANPIGIGRRAQPDETGQPVRALPNIEDPARPIRGSRQRVEPAGFGPLAAGWKLRQSKVGRYRKRWLKKRWPGLPEDFDSGYFNAAPPGLQVPFLEGDERIRLENLHPEHELIEASLPGLRVRTFACDRPPHEPEAGFRELEMQLDTLWIDADSLTLVLVWRGQTEIASEDLDEALSHLYVSSEPVEASPEPMAVFQSRLIERLEAQAKEEEIADVAPSPRTERDRVDVNALAEKEMAKLKAELAAAGVELDENPKPTEEAKAKEIELRERYGIGRPKRMPLGRQDVIQLVADGESLAGAKLARLDLSGASLAGADFEGAVLSFADLSGADLTGANLDGTTLMGALLAGARLPGARLADTDLAGADLSRADLSACAAPEANFDGARLDEAKLGELDAPDAIFSEASLAGTDLRAAKLEGADFSLARIDGARFDGAELAEACFEGASGEQVIFDGADLRELRGAGALLPGGNFRRTRAAESIFEGADLRGADFSFAQLAGANFMGADLQEASLHAAELKQARLEKARLVGASATHCNFFDAVLAGADLKDADLTGAHLFGADLVDTTLDGAELAGADLERARYRP